jgi:type I restriction enzyme R subunit
MFIEATDKKTFVEALDSPRRIIVVNIQKFLDLQQAIDESGKKLKTMRVAFLIDEIHRSNSGETNQEMINLFERLQDSFRKEDGVQVVKKNLLIGFTATPSEDTLARFGEFKSASIVPLWVPFDSYTMKEAIEDGYILDPTKNIYPYAVPVKFDSVEIDEELINEDDPVKIRQSKTSVYSYEPRIRKIAEFVVDRLVSLVYGKIRGEGKAMLAVSSIPNAIKYIEIIRNLYAEKCKQKQYEKYADAPICIVYSDSQSYQNCASLNGGKSESAVIQDFKQSKNGLIIVVDKLQTGFDEPKLHTLFLDKEISDINAIQTISRVNRTCKNKFECHIIDCSWHNVNMQNIKTAFKKYCDIVISDFNPEEQAKSISKFYRELCASDIYKNWFEQFTKNAEDTSFILKMEDGFRVWIRQCIERESAIKKQNAENGWIEGMPEYQTPENEARDLRLLIGEYSSAIESVKNIYDIDSRYYNEQFLLFWQIYCRIFREATRKRNDDDVYVVEPVDIDDSGFTLVETEAEEPKVSGKGGTKPKIKEPKGKTISDVIKLIENLNEEEGISVQCVAAILPGRNGEHLIHK